MPASYGPARPLARRRVRRPGGVPPAPIEGHRIAGQGQEPTLSSGGEPMSLPPVGRPFNGFAERISGVQPEMQKGTACLTCGALRCGCHPGVRGEDVQGGAIIAPTAPRRQATTTAMPDASVVMYPFASSPRTRHGIRSPATMGAPLRPVMALRVATSSTGAADWRNW